MMSQPREKWSVDDRVLVKEITWRGFGRPYNCATLPFRSRIIAFNRNYGWGTVSKNSKIYFSRCFDGVSTSFHTLNRYCLRSTDDQLMGRLVRAGKGWHCLFERHGFVLPSAWKISSCAHEAISAKSLPCIQSIHRVYDERFTTLIKGGVSTCSLMRVLTLRMCYHCAQYCVFLDWW